MKKLTLGMIVASFFVSGVLLACGGMVPYVKVSSSTSSTSTTSSSPLDLPELTSDQLTTSEAGARDLTGTDDAVNVAGNDEVLAQKKDITIQSEGFVQLGSDLLGNGSSATTNKIKYTKNFRTTVVTRGRKYRNTWAGSYVTSVTSSTVQTGTSLTSTTQTVYSMSMDKNGRISLSPATIEDIVL